MNADTQAPFAGTKDTDPKEPKPLPMLQVLQKLRNGRLLEQLRNELYEVVKEVTHSPTGKGGKVSLTLRVERVSKNQGLQGNQIAIIAEPIKSVSPDDPPEGHVFYFDEEGGLHARNPRQLDAFPDD